MYVDEHGKFIFQFLSEVTIPIDTQYFYVNMIYSHYHLIKKITLSLLEVLESRELMELTT